MNDEIKELLETKEMVTWNNWARVVAEFSGATKNVNDALMQMQEAMEKLNYIYPAKLKPDQFAIRMRRPR